MKLPRVPVTHINPIYSSKILYSQTLFQNAFSSQTKWLETAHVGGLERHNSKPAGMEMYFVPAWNQLPLLCSLFFDVAGLTCTLIRCLST